MGIAANLSLGRLDDTHHFFVAPAQREALARMHFALEHSFELAILTGENGSGKSRLLSQFQREMRASPFLVFHINLNGLTTAELTLRFAAFLGVEASCPEYRLWTNITRRLAELSCQATPLVVLGDDAHLASPSILDWLARLWGILPADRWRLTTLLAMPAASLAELPAAWQDRLDLRVDLEPWSRDDLRDYLAAIADPAAAPLPQFTETALASLHELSQGLPRKVRRLARVALLAAIGQKDNWVEDSMLQAVEAELCSIS